MDQTQLCTDRSQLGPDPRHLPPLSFRQQAQKGSDTPRPDFVRAPRAPVGHPLRDMSRIVGIDLGTTNSLVATVDSGIPLVIADTEGRRLTRSVVHYPAAASGSSPGGSAPWVGETAHRVRAVRPAETLYSVKRFMGRRGTEIPAEELLVSYPVSAGSAGPVTFEVHGRAVNPEEVSAEILKKLKRDAEAFLGEPVTRAVITVPAYFNDAQRNATKKAGELAGFTVERILNEPTAAALAYGFDRLKEHARVSVYDLGGGTFDLSILELSNGVFQVLATSGNTRLGGDDLDRRLLEHLVQRTRESGGPDLSSWLDSPAQPAGGHAGPGPNPGPGHGQDWEPRVALSRLREAAEEAKIRLSSETEVEVTLPFLTPSFNFSCRLSRAELERLTRDLIERTRTHCLRALADSKLEAKDLDQVILVGGQTRMPLVRRLVSEWFGCPDFEETRGDVRLGADFHRAAGPKLNTSQNPDEAVALGAAIQAEILAGGCRNLLLLDVTPLSLGLETFGGLMNVILPRNTTLPAKAGEAFTTAVDNQREVLIHVLQGERERARDNWSLGRFVLEFDPAPRGIPRVGVQFEIDANGILHVLARDLKTGREKVVEMKSTVDVDDAEVQRMVEDSVEHFFEDVRARRWIENKLKATETLAAAKKGLSTCEAELEPGYREQVAQAIQSVETVLDSADPATQIGDPDKLKSATGSLDEVTKPLADLLMDKAMEAMLRRKGLLPG